MVLQRFLPNSEPKLGPAFLLGALTTAGRAALSFMVLGKAVLCLLKTLLSLLPCLKGKILVIAFFLWLIIIQVFHAKQQGFSWKNVLCDSGCWFEFYIQREVSAFKSHQGKAESNPGISSPWGDTLYFC